MGPAEAYTPSFALNGYQTIKRESARLHHRDPQYSRSTDEEISLEFRKDVPVVRAMSYQLADAVWSEDHSSITVSSLVVPPDNRKRPPSALLFQSNLRLSSLLSFSASPITRHRCNPICNLLGPSSPNASNRPSRSLVHASLLLDFPLPRCLDKLCDLWD